jgi:hypothetical protein
MGHVEPVVTLLLSAVWHCVSAGGRRVILLLDRATGIAAANNIFRSRRRGDTLERPLDHVRPVGVM